MIESRRHFHEELDSLVASLVAMAGLAERAVDKAVAALVSGDATRADEVVAEDQAIDDLYRAIHQDWLETMALYLPFQGIYYIPNAIFIGKISGTEILLSLGVQLFWAGASYLLLRFVWNRASQKVVVQGG